MSLHCSISVCSVQGSRPQFEDRVDVRARVHGEYPFLYCAIFDGHCGTEAADLARSSLMTALSTQKDFPWLEFSNFPKQASSAFHQTNEFIRKCMRTSSGTTATTMFLIGRTLFFSYVGDSPIWIGREVHGGICMERISIDHRLSFQPEFDRIQQLGGDVLNIRGRMVVRSGKRWLEMTRSLGDFWVVSPFGQELISCIPSCLCVELTDDVAFVVLSSDGVGLDQWRLAAVLEESRRYNQNPAQAVVKKNVEVFADTKTDNTSAVVVSFKSYNYCQNDENVPPVYLPFGGPASLVANFNNLFRKRPDVILTIDDVEVRCHEQNVPVFKSLSFNSFEPGFVRF